MKAQDEDDQVTSDWKFAATVLDRFLLWFFSIGTVLATVAILLGAPNMFSPYVSLPGNSLLPLFTWICILKCSVNRQLKSNFGGHISIL